MPIILIPSLLAAAGHGQRARLFSTNKELPNSLIGDIYQDQRGVIWIATEDGINRYDGAKFTIALLTN